MADGSAPILFDDTRSLAADAGKAIVVLMAGFGGVTIAVKAALGRDAEAVLNHWPLALGVHAANNPNTIHHCADVMETDCRTVLPGREIGLLQLSPDCRHFSPAKGSPIVSPRIRALAWAAIPWIKLRRPDVVILENVEAFLTWAPVIEGPDGKFRADPARKGQTWRRWVRCFHKEGYTLEYRVESVADHGGHTIRKRLKVIARCDGLPIIWPEATHAPRKVAAAKGLKPHRPAAEILDFSRPVHSIFMSQSQARQRGLKIKRPLEEATMKRIAVGLFRHTIASADPYIVHLTHHGSERTHDIRDGLPTVTGAHRGELALAAPHLIPITQRTWKDGVAYDVAESLRAITTSKGGEFALAAAHLEEMNSRSAGAPLDAPAPGFTERAHHGLVAAFMEQANTGMVGHDLRGAVSTIMSKGANQRLIAAQLTHFRGSNTGGGEGGLKEPLRASTAGGQHQALLEAALEREHDMTVPFRPDGSELRAFLVKYYGTATAEDHADPLSTATSRSRLGLVVVAGVAYRIVDIGMRMLDPETELAAAMGVPTSGPGKYVLGWTADGRRVSKTDITKGVGNMVARQWMEKIVALNCGHLAAPGHVWREAA